MAAAAPAQKPDLLKPVRLGVIGAGFIGRKHIQTIAGEPRAVLVAIADPAPEAKILGQELGVEVYANTSEMLAASGPDGVIVCTPTEHHLEPTLAALEAGSHVLIEKPIAPNAEEAGAIADKARETRLSVLVGHHRRYAPVLTRAREIISSGDIGKLVAVNGQWSVKKDDGYFSSDWRKRRAAGPILTNLIHEIDTLRFICGELTSLSAMVTHTVRGLEKEDAVAMIMEFASGAIGTFVLSDGTPSPWTWEQATGENPTFPFTGHNTHHFTGTAGSLEFPQLALWRQAQDADGWRDPIACQKQPGLAAQDQAGGDAFARQCAHFCAVVRGREIPLVSAEDGAKSLAATLAVFDAARTGQRVML